VPKGTSQKHRMATSDASFLLSHFSPFVFSQSQIDTISQSRPAKIVRVNRGNNPREWLRV